MKKVIPIFIVIILTVGIWYFFRSEPPKRYPTAGTNIIAFGDSLVAGEGASRGGDFVALLSEQTDMSIINAGVPGDTTASALRRLEQDVLVQNPKVVLVLLGGNDAIRKIDRDDTFQNLAKIIDRIQARGAAVLLIGIQSGLLSDKYDSEFEALAYEKGVWLVPDILNGIIGHGELMSDAIHPNNKGYQIITSRIEPTLREILRGP